MSNAVATNSPALSPKFVLLMATACGLCAGSAYFNQPLIYSIEKSLGISTSQAGFAVVLAQIGYGLGLMLLVPLGDLLNKRKLIVSLMVFAAFSQILLSFQQQFSHAVFLYRMCHFWCDFGTSAYSVWIEHQST